MKNIVLCNKHSINVDPTLKLHPFSIQGKELYFTEIDVNHSEFESDNEKYFDFVYIKKRAFSCNYRDLAMLLILDKNCHAEKQNGDLLYSSFGSEFVGEVVGVGKNVTEFKLGDRVIPNGCFPFRKNGFKGGLPTNMGSKRYQYFHRSQLITIPKNITDEIACCITVSGQTTLSMIRQIDLTSKKKSKCSYCIRIVKYLFGSNFSFKK